MPKGNEKMHDGMTLEMGSRVAEWMRQAYPRDTAKLAARDFGASPHTVKTWLAGALPSNKHLAMMGRRWGKRFLAFVYEPVVGPWRHYAMDEELQMLRSRIAAIEREFLHDPIGAPAGAVVGAISNDPVASAPPAGGRTAATD